MKITTYICDHCGKEVSEPDLTDAYGTKEEYCPTCYAEWQGLQNIGSQLDQYLIQRWREGGLDLVAESVALVSRTAEPDENSSVGKFVSAVLTCKPLDFLHGDMQLGPYELKSFYEKTDKYGRHGFNIYRNGVLVSIIRWRKTKSGHYRWEDASAWDSDKPGKLLWNMAEADHTTDLGEAVLLAVQKLEMDYDRWIGNIYVHVYPDKPVTIARVKEKGK